MKEHPFGTLKQWMGATHFLTRKLAGKCRDELERARLQLETGQENHGCQWLDEGAVGLKRFVLSDLDSCKTLLKGTDAILINMVP